MITKVNPEEAVEEFLSYLENEKGYSENTLSNYLHDINDFSAFLKVEKMAKDILHISKRHPDYYVSYLSAKNLAATSIHRKISALSSFYEFLVKEQLYDNNYFKDVVEPKIPKRLPKVISTNEIEMMLNSCDLDIPHKKHERKALYAKRALETMELEVKNLDN
jgi:integrase/recombinase XerC